MICFSLFKSERVLVNLNKLSLFTEISSSVFNKRCFKVSTLALSIVLALSKEFSSLVKVSFNSLLFLILELILEISVASKASSSNSLAAKVEGMTPIVKTLNTSAYTASTCGKKAGSKGYGVTASGKKASSWYTVAAGKSYPVGTVIYVPALKNKPNGGWFVVQDRGGAISNNRLDIYMSTYNECIQFGRKNLECYIYVK